MKFRSRYFAAVLLALTPLLELMSAQPAQGQVQKAAPKPSHPAKLAVDPRADPLRIAFISYANPQQVMQDTKAVAAYLEPFVGVPIKSFVTLDYGSAVEAMRGGQADLAFVDPLAFMMAHEQIGAKPLLLEVYSSGKPTYHSSIWVRKDSGIKTLADLKGKTIAFADQIDMSGHLLPREIFVREGLLTAKPTQDFFKQIYFSGGDEQAVRSVLNKFVDAAGVSQYAFMLLRPEERDQVTAIAHSISSPAHLVMARKDLDPKISERFKQALLALESANPEDKLILGKLYGVQGFVEAKMSDFSEVAGIAARYGFVKKPQLFASAPRP
jgi:phosphonate transport system substrate-binding protein